ncbi:MAG: carbohydrate kinase family protein [Chloroflexi bacterium]|nr:carbohydrate kinase family protein [Chloroflexota bacterium]
MNTDKYPDPEIVVIGCASIDVKGKALETLLPATSNPGEIRISVGGAARNIAENLGRLGMRPILLTAVGGDGFGRLILRQTSEAGIDISEVLICPDALSAKYLAIISPDGELEVSIDDMGLMSQITPDYIKAKHHLFRQVKMIVMDANLHPRTVTTILAIARRHHVPACVNPVSIILARRIKRHLKHFAIVTPTLAEAEVLCGHKITGMSGVVAAARHLVAAGVELAIITLAEQGLVYATMDSYGHIPAPSCEVVDRTGASDALTAAVVYGLVNGFAVDEAMRLGVSAAALTLMSKETVSPELDLEHLYQTMQI